MGAPALIDAEATERIGASRYERSDERVAVHLVTGQPSDPQGRRAVKPLVDK